MRISNNLCLHCFYWSRTDNKCKAGKGKGKIGWFYLGKHEVIIDILKMFEQLEG